ncbi:hypothetical protein JCM3775_002339 [Rhodotorula graminis]|uniref:Uncharacterized protein n=1 Tax=Rhodotorula graminis (strain WP1) TaxID=578459 RepID=A0A194S652_RHOGW|nr:uncharacterized protein RHOBADRAFT_53024 [Rhodotorula graminis WP1]KPV76024.1 hypothetical protein RHOBADRAFT_53024 [Rhodotorula graminis WP1]
MSAPITIPGPPAVGGAAHDEPQPGGEGEPDSLSSSPGDVVVHSTSPPCVPRLPPSPGSAPPPSQSILLNPLPAKTRSRSPPRLHNPFRRASLDQQLAPAPPAPQQPQPAPAASTSTLPDQAPQRRRAPSVTVEVYQSPPPAHFFNQDASDSSVPATPTFSTSPPRAQRVPHGMRSRSVSPAAPHSHSAAAAAAAAHSSPSGNQSLQLPSSPGGSSTLTLDSTASSNGSSAGTSVKFAPLPPGRRAHRSNSLSIGVASRAQMIQSQGGTPNVRSAKYAGPLAWHEGGPLPEDVYSWKDVQRGMSKLFKRVKGSSTTSAASATSTSGASNASTAGESDAGADDESAQGRALADEGAAFRGRSLSMSSATSSSGSVDEARRMEREAKGKSREIEHIEEAIEEELPEDSREDVPATVDDDELDDDEGRPRFGDDEDDETSASELTAPRTPPDGLVGVAAAAARGEAGDGDLDVERRRVRKGKGVDDAEHRGVQVAST